MYTNFAINNNTNSSQGRRQETLKKLAKNVFEQSQKKERDLGHVLTENEYFTKEYIPAEIYICNISGKACLNNNIEKSLKFLNKQATIKNLHIQATEEVEELGIRDTKEFFEVDLDNAKNIFAA